MSKKNTTNESVLKDFAGGIISLYLTAMFTFYPLYMSEGFYYLSQYKFQLFKIISITAFIFCMFPTFAFIWKYFDDKRNGLTSEEKLLSFKSLRHPAFFVLLSFLSSFISFTFSLNKKNSFRGVIGFGTGFFLQLMVVAMFFLIMNYYKNSNYVWIAAFVGSEITYVLAILNRFGIYPIDTETKDPEYISTIGQTNWFCAYIICFAAMGIGFFTLFEFKERYKFIIYALLELYNLSAFAALWVSGSDSALIISAVLLFTMLGFAITERDKFIKFLVCTLSFLITPEILYLFMFKIFPGRFNYFQEEDTVNTLIKSHVCGYMAIIVALVLVLEFLLKKKKAKWNDTILRTLYKVAIGFVIVGVVAMVILIYRVTTAPEQMGRLANISLLNFNETWGTWRGQTWRIAVKSFMDMPIFRKLIGVGTGCYPDYTYSLKEISDVYDTYVFDEIMPNAHNDYLTVLIENGILGFITILAVFISMGVYLHKKASKNPYAAIAFSSIVAYAINLFVSFKTIVSTPYIFIFAAIAMSVEGELNK